MSAVGRMLEGRHATGRGARGVRWLLSGLLLVVAAPQASAQTEVVEYYGQDALGSVRIVFNASGAAIARADYEPFGELFAVPNMPGTSGLPGKQFTGQERDAEASLDYFGARFFVPRTGRFSEVDPVYAGLFDPQQWNRYAYARNNPIIFVDPDGRQFTTGVTCPFGGNGTPACPWPIHSLLPGADNSLNQFPTAQLDWLEIPGGSIDPVGGATPAEPTEPTTTTPIIDVIADTGDLTHGLGTGAVVGASAAAGAAAVRALAAVVSRLGPQVVSVLSRIPGVQWVQQQRFINLASSAIGRGHAFSKHNGQFPQFGGSQAQFTAHVRNVMANPSDWRALSNGRQAFWHDATQTIVIYDPKNVDLGTAFKTSYGYFMRIR